MENYLKIIFEELLLEDGLCLLGKGIGIEKLYLKFIKLFSLNSSNSNSNSNSSSNNKVIFCLNSIDEIKWIKEYLYSDGLQQINFPKVKFKIIYLIF